MSSVSAASPAHPEPAAVASLADIAVATTELTKRYGDHTVVDRVDLRVRRGEVYGFLGPNGAGKTTTLRMLLGLVRPSSGVARVLGRRPGDPAGLARIGALIEGPGFYPYLSGRDNLRVLARMRGLDNDHADRALERVGLSGRGRDRFRSYSLGMKQRLGVAATLLSDPDLLILDEPTNGLDPGGVAEMRRLIVGLAAGGHTVLLSSHLLAEAQQICHRVGVLSHGRLVVESSVRELRSSAAIFLRATPADRARAVAGQEFGSEAVHDEGAGIRIDVPPERAPVLARRLVAAGVDVWELRGRERSLEDLFFDVTGDPS